MDGGSKILCLQARKRVEIFQKYGVNPLSYIHVFYYKRLIHKIVKNRNKEFRITAENFEEPK
jgi:hypothetical protein